MTYCITASINEGLVLISDSRTNAGVDNVSIYSKMHTFETHTDRVLVLLSAGNLATTQAVIEQVHRDKVSEAQINLNTVESLSAAANYLGKVSVEKQKQHNNDEGQNAFDSSASFILAGEIANDGREHGAYMIYSEGNNITTSANTPFLQIGEIKYGKPVLDRFLKPDTLLDEAALCSLVSMDSTVRSNVSVGPPIELLIYRKGSFSLNEYYCFQGDDKYMQKLRRRWEENLKQAFMHLPELDKSSIKPLLKARL